MNNSRYGCAKPTPDGFYLDQVLSGQMKIEPGTLPICSEKTVVCIKYHMKMKSWKSTHHYYQTGRPVTPSH